MKRNRSLLVHLTGLLSRDRLNPSIGPTYERFQPIRYLARTYLQTPLPLPEFFPIGQWNRFKLREVRHLTDPLALKLVRNGTKVSLMGAVMLFSLIMQPWVL